MLDIKTDFVQDLKLPDGYTNMQLEMLEEGDSRYMKDSRVNLKNVLSSEFLTAKETALIGLAISANQKNERLIVFFKEKAELEEASAGEIAEAVACASLLATNNV
ncbi:MAG: alkylhydroperoxidase, partial [Cytophagales bacterium]|nr:alkylhydroperoxidase [Cytophagales bacterium]